MPRTDEICRLVLKVCREYSCRGDGERSVAASGQSCKWNIQYWGRWRPQTLSTRHFGDWLKGISQVGRSKSTDALVHHTARLKDICCGARSQCMQATEHENKRGNVIRLTILFHFKPPFWQTVAATSNFDVHLNCHNIRFNCKQNSVVVEFTGNIARHAADTAVIIQGPSRQFQDNFNFLWLAETQSPWLFTARRYAERGICYAYSVCLSVCTSVCLSHARDLYQNGWTYRNSFTVW